MDEDKVILIVDDEAEIIELVTDILQENGFRLLTAIDGVQALDVLAMVDKGVFKDLKGHGFQQVDMVLTDIRMPKMKGDQLIEIVEKTYPQIRRAFMTGFSDPSDVRRRTPTIKKPFTVRELIGFVEDVLFEAA